MKDYRYSFDKNIEINYTQNNTSINYKNNNNIGSINPSIKKKKDLIYFPSYNTRQFKEENNEKQLIKLNSKYSTCYNYYPRKNYSKYLNHNKEANSSFINKNINNQQNTTFDDGGIYNKLLTKDLIEITKKRQEIMNQQKIIEQEKKKYFSNNLEDLDIILNENINKKNKTYCDEGVQTSLINNFQIDNKKEESGSTIIFTDKSALINQEITFLSIQYSLNKNNKESNNNNNSDTSKEYKITENNDFVNVDYENKENININKIKEKTECKTKTDKSNINSNEEINNINSTLRDLCIDKKNKEDNNFQNDLEFTIINNIQSLQKEGNNENNYMTNGPETFQIEVNDQEKDKINNNLEDENFNVNKDSSNKFQLETFNDSLENFQENDHNKDINKSKSLLNTEENEITEIEEFDQNLILLQNQSKTMSSHFENINNKSNLDNEENQMINNNNILIEDISNNNNNDEINFDSLNDSLSLKNKMENINIEENKFQNGEKQNNSLNKYKEHTNFRNIIINDDCNLNSKLYIKNNLTNNDRYQNNNKQKEKDIEYYDFLKLKKSELTKNNKDNYCVMKPLMNLDLNSKEYDCKTNITSYNKSKNDIQNIKVFSKNKLNITTNEDSKINISGIPICPKKPKNNINNKNSDIKNNNKYINNESNKNINIKNIKSIKTNNNNNYLVTPRCIKKKRQLNNYADYYRLKILKNKDLSNIQTNIINSNLM